MHLTFGSVATLAARFDRLAARIDPGDKEVLLERAVARKVNPSAIANASRGASIRQAIAGPQPVRRPGRDPVSSEHGTATSPATSRATPETPSPSYQVNVAKLRALFGPPASKSNKAQPGMHRAMEPGKSMKTSGPAVKNHLANIIRDRKATLQACEASVAPVAENIEQPAKFSMKRIASPPMLSTSPDRDSGLGSPVDSTQRSEPLDTFLQFTSVNRDIDSSKDALFPAADKHAPSGYGSDSSSSTGSSPPVSPGSESGPGGPVNEILREPILPSDKVSVSMLELSPPSARLAALQSRFDTSYIERSSRMLSPASSEESLDSYHSAGVPDTEMSASVYKQSEPDRYFINLTSPAPSKAEARVEDELLSLATHSDYESDLSGSLSPSSPPGSPVAREPASPWSKAYAEALRQPPFSPPDDEITWVEVTDAIGELNAAIADGNKYDVSDDAIELLALAESYIVARNISSAYDAVMRALEGVTEIKAVKVETIRRSSSPHLLSPPDSEYDSDADEYGDEVPPLPQGYIDAWMNARPEFISARDRILATIQSHAGTTWAESAAVLLTEVEAEWHINRHRAIDMAHDGLKSIADTPRLSIAVKF